MIRINDFTSKATLKAAVLMSVFLLFVAASAFGQQQINLTAAPTTVTMPDGTVVPMWGYFCGTGATGSTATCAALNPASVATATWSPVVITVPTGQALTINLTNNLSFTPAGTTTANKIPTSIVMVGQVGGGLGVVAQRTTTPSPNHSLAQDCATWFIASGATPPGVACPGSQNTTANPTASGTPPAQGPRVRSMATEVAAGTTAALTWAALKPGTYLLESGTHPSIQVPMGLIGVLVVTTAPSGTTAGTAYPAVGTAPAVPYNAELPMEFSEIDPVQNKAVDTAVRTPGFNEMNMKTFGGQVGTITVLSGGSGYTASPAVTISSPGTSGTQATASAVVGKVITGIALPSTGSGSGYTAPPAVTITDTGTPITTASAVAVMGVGGITAPTAGTGSNYVVGDHVQFTGGGGAGASGAVATVSTTGAILTVNVTNPGADYTSAPTAVVGGTGAVLTPVLSTTVAGTVGSVTVTAPGAGYVVGDIVTFTGTSTTAATGTVGTVNALGGILTVTISNAGAGYTAAPTATVGGTGAALTTAFVVSGITVTSGGSGYTAPSATIPGPTTTSAAITLTVSTAGATGSVYAVDVTNGGSGYGTAPTVSIAAGTTTAIATASFSQSCDAAGSTGLASGAAAGCYPSAVNYTPFYYLINGVAFNKTNAAASVFAATAGVSTTGVPVTTGITGTVLVRVVNAGLRLHVPSIVNSLTKGFSGAGASATVAGFTLIAEDGNVLPGVAPPGAATTAVPVAPRVQTDALMVPSKVYDMLVNVPVTATGATSTPALPIYDRQLSLSGNSSVRDAGMLAYISVNNATLTNALPVAPGTAGSIFAPAVARPDTYNALAAGQVFSVSDASKGVIANDTNVYGVTLLVAPASGTLTCEAQPQNSVPGLCANGTFTYHPNGTAVSDSFTYCANGTVTGTTCSSGITATVTLGQSALTGNPTAIAQSYTAHTSTFIKIPSPGLLLGNSDPSGLSLSLVTSPAPTASAGTLVVDPKGGFSIALPPTTTTGSTVTFNYTVQNSQGRMATGSATVTFPTPSNLSVRVVDAQAYNNCALNSSCINGLVAPAVITDYRWIIEEDQTFWVDPNCTTNASITTPGCPMPVATGGTIPVFGVNFHTSTMTFVAQGCTGPLSCEGGQTVLDTRPTIPSGTTTIPNPNFGLHVPAVCDLGNGACRPDPNCSALPCLSAGGTTPSMPSSVHLDPTKRYYISILPGDAANPFPSNPNPPVCTGGPITGSGATATLNTACGHTMSGAAVPPACNFLIAGCTSTSTVAFAPVTVLVLPTPLPTGRLSIVVFEDDFPLNGEQDGGGGSGTVAPLEPGLGGFNIVLWDTYGGLGDVTGQDTYDMFNMPLSNALAGTIDPATGFGACPISATPLTGPGGAGTAAGAAAAPVTGMTSMIVTCPKYESDGSTLSPLAGQAVVANLMPEKFSVQAYPGADRIARGEEWLQTNTLDGQHPHDSFIRIGEPSYFQEYGPAGYHVSIGFANPAIINARANDVCAGAGTPGAVGPCTNTIDGQVDVQRLSRTPDQRLYPSGSRDAFAWTQCWVSLGDPDGEDFMFTKCDAQGNFKFTNVPGGNWRLTIGDQWNDQIIDGLSTPANVGCTSNAPNGTINATTCPGGQTLHMGNIGVQQWQSNIYTRTFIDDNKNGIWDPGEIGIPFNYTMIHYRDGHNANALVTDFNGIANFNETFPLFNWYVVGTDDSATNTRYKRTGTHTVYDAGGPADGSPSCGNGTTARQCGTSTAYHFLSNTFESVPLPADLSVPGAVYCTTADCAAQAASYAAGTAVASSTSASTGRIDPPWVWAEAYSGLTSHSEWIDFGMAPYASCPPACATVTVTPAGGTATTMQVAENGGIHGKTVYSSTRPFDSAQQMIQQPWEPNVPRVTVNLYQEGFAADGVTPTLTQVDTTQSTSWDDWAQGFYPNSTAGSGAGAGQKPYMNCPGQGTNVAGSPNQDLFFFSLMGQPNFLDLYNSQHNGGTLHTLPYNSQFKCYDAMHIGDQLQPAVYDGRYFFPSSLGVDPTTGKLLTTMGSTNGVASSMAGTNCTVCVANPDTTDHYRVGTPMLPPGKYVVEVIMPPGFEVYKEEDKNLLIGDNFIAPVTQQFGGLGTDIFIMPDQANIASMYDPNAAGYNPNNFQDQTVNLGLQEGMSGVPGFPGFQDPNWPCVGEMRVVPDYLSEFPQAKEVAPFAGATRPLCDRKEVTLANQMSVSAKFFIFTSTHIASKFAGVITDDFTSEFDPFAPQFGEKFGPPNMAVSTKDYLGNEISRVYSDHWGAYDGLTFSSWEVNPPNITGYSPTMMIQCMNDPGPIVDTRTTIPNPLAGQTGQPATIPNPTLGQLITDPLYNPAYSDFCYEEPYMPGLTNYTDTPVVPTEAFVGAGYNNVDCSYPDATPAIAEVDGDGIGPYVARSGVTLTITALGDQQVNNSAYSGPSANAAPFNQKTITRHYGFGSQCLSPTAGSTTCNTLSQVTIGGRAAVIDSWSDTQIQVTVPTGVPACPIQQQTQYGGSAAQCGQLVITAGNGKQSVDTVTVTIGGKVPTHVAASASIQAAIDAATPGDLIIVDPTCMTVATPTAPATGAACSAAALHAATPTQTTAAGAHTEMLIMWKPVRLQGVGAASSVVNGNAHPSGKLLDPWRRHINCLFGLTLQGVPYTAAGGTAPYDPNGIYSCPDTGWLYFTAQPNVPQIDRLPLEATVGWNATLNGNLAEQLQEPSLMGGYEGAGITVLAKGLDFHGGIPWTDGTEGGAFPAGTTLLTGVGPDPTALPVGDANPLCIDGTNGANRFPSNFVCNPSSIDGLSVINSSQGGGGIFAHGWAHHLQIANNRVYNNAGTLSGGISVGQGEFAGPYVVGGTTNAPPGSCSSGTGFVTNQHLPDCFQILTNVHHNFVTNNSSLGDELFSAGLAGGGGVTFCTGNDYYKFNYNWVCGNLSSGEGGGLVHLGEIQNGDIEHNSIVLNQSDNPTIPTNGGGIQIMGTPDVDPVCIQIDADCLPPGLSDGVGHNLTINANLIQGNSAQSGSGGGIRLQDVNGSEVSTFPTQPNLWNNVSITNNMIVNNVAGWDGAGISLQDALNVSIVNNTIASNDSLASSGVLTQSVGSPHASSPPGACVEAGSVTSCPQSAGVTSTTNSSVLTTTFTGLTITCPFGQPGCMSFSNPLLANNVIWQNRSFKIGVGTLGTGTLNQQNIVTLFTASGSAAPTQTASGQCSGTGVTYWDVGVRGDTGPGNHSSGSTLNPTYSVLDDPGYSATNLTGNPNIVSQYCNGSRVPPECSVANGCAGPSGYGVPPGIVDAQAPNPVFTLTPSATVDEGNNWINVSWGPLALANDAVTGGANGNYGGGNAFGNYALNPGSPAQDYVPTSTASTAPFPGTDFFGNPRPDPGNPTHFDVGAVEIQNAGNGTASLTSISPSSGAQGTVVNVTITGTGLTTATAVNVSGSGITVGTLTVTATTVTTTFTIATNAALTARNVTVTTSAGTSNAVTFTVTAPATPTLTSISPASELRGTSVNVTLTGTNFVTGATVNAVPAVAGFSISNVVVVSATSITATFTSTTGTPIGNVNIDVVTAGGASNTLPFAITGPVLTSIAPASGNRGSSVPVTLTGSGLAGTTAVNVSGGGVTVSALTVVSDTSVTATFTFTGSATGGARNVTTTSAAGTSNAVTFTVIVPPGAVSSISPNTGARGTAVPVTISGTGLTGSTGINVSGAGSIAISGFTVVNDTTITATFTISPTAPLTARNVTVNTAGGLSNPVTFTVVSPGTPTLASISPNSGLRSVPGIPNPVLVTLTGTGFTAAGTTVGVVAPANGLTITGVTYVSATTLTATFNTTSGAAIGPRSIFVTTPGGTTGTVTYTVTGPVLTSIAPTSAVRGQGVAIPVSLFGSGLTGATAVTVSGGGGITIGAITVVNDNQVNTTFTIPAGAAGTARNVTVTAPGGVSNPVTFTVVIPATPTLTSVAPPTGVRGTAVAVTLTGTNFRANATVAVSGGGITVSGVTVVSPTQINATFTISTTASLTTAHNVTVTVPGAVATSNTVPFTVQGATLTSITPNSVTRPATGTTTVSITLSGSNLGGATGLTGVNGGLSVVAGSFTVVNSSTITATINVPSGATAGIRNIGVTTNIGTTNTIPFTVN